MKYYLVKYRDNLADEIDVEGFFCIQTPLSFQEWLEEKCNAAFENPHVDTIVYCIGINEDIIYKSPGSLLQAYSIEKLTIEQYITILNIFPKGFGCRGPLEMLEN